MNDGSISDLGHGLTSGTHAAPLGQGDMALGVAALQSSAVQQTKSEIHSLASEISELASRPLVPQEFYEGFLPRLRMAMGAKGAAVWSQSSSGEWQLEAEHSLPAPLLDGEFASAGHSKVLQCVAAEGEPILVPPGHVSLAAERPANPIADSLLVVPVRIEENVEFLLEVVQRPSGGPAAQRGYLRFVAQMADLMADSLRRHRLRQHRQLEADLSHLQQSLLKVAASAPGTPRYQATVDALQGLLQADRGLLLRKRRSARVLAVSGLSSFDVRGDVIVAAQAVVQHVDLEGEAGGTAERWIATDRRVTPTTEPSGLQAAVDQLCHAVGARSVLLLRLPPQPLCVLLTFAEPLPAALEPVLADQQRLHQLAQAVGGLLAGPRSSWQLSLPWNAAQKNNSTRAARLQSWIGRVAATALLLVVGFFPVPQQIQAVATLQPRSRQTYYAPASGIVTEIHVEEGEVVTDAQPLLQITSHSLQTEYASLRIELQATEARLEEKQSLLNRGEGLTLLEKDRLEFELRELQSGLQALQQRSRETQARLDELAIEARAAGTVSAWDIQNRLLHHPVQMGDELIATYDPDGIWELNIAIPEYRVGLVSAAMRGSANGTLPVQFSLASHPDRLLDAHCIGLAGQVTDIALADHGAPRVVQSTAVVEAPEGLPLRKQGAVARATLQCGSVPFGWLVIRDAYAAVSARIQMYW